MLSMCLSKVNRYEIKKDNCVSEYETRFSTTPMTDYLIDAVIRRNRITN